MKKFWLLLLFSTGIGIASAWAITHNRFGKRYARMGPFTMDREITPDNVMEYVASFVPEGEARVELDGEENYDFGMMSPGTEGEHVFVVRNVGTDSLSLRLGATTCKCTLGELENDSLAPGEETEIKLSWTVKSGESNFSQSAQIITNDPENLTIDLGITGKVVNEISLEPDVITFGRVATGEGFDLEGTIYNFMEHDMKPKDVKFSADNLNDVAEFDIEEFQPTDEDGVRRTARQGFRVKAKMNPGLRQGVVSQNMIFGFTKIDENGEEVEEAQNADGQYYIMLPVKGSIVGPLSMIPNSKLTGDPEGGYIYNFGKLDKDSNLKAKSLVVLKGEEREKTKLSIGRIVPEGVVKATLGEPNGRGSMVVYPLEIELLPGTEPIERLGKNSDDYGAVWIESDNPKVSKMRVALKFAIPAAE